MIGNYRDYSTSELNRILSAGQVVQDRYASWDFIEGGWGSYSNELSQLDLRRTLNLLDNYNILLLNKNSNAMRRVQEVYHTVAQLDQSYGSLLRCYVSQLKHWAGFIDNLSQQIHPGLSIGIQVPVIITRLQDILSKDRISIMRQRLIQTINGKLVVDKDLLYEYIKMDPSQLSAAEQGVVLEAINEVKDSVDFYSSAAVLGHKELTFELLRYLRWVDTDTTFTSFTGIALHYHKVYLNLLNKIEETTKDQHTFAANLATLGMGSAMLSVLGVETYENLKDVFGTRGSFTAYLAKYKSEHTEQYFLKLEESENVSWKFGGKFKDNFKGVENLDDKLNDWMEKRNLSWEDKDTKYYKNGKLIDEKDAPEFYKRQLKLAEVKASKSISGSLYEGAFDVGGGELSVTVGNAEAHGEFAGGLYMVGKDGKSFLCPGVSAEVGVSVTAFEASYENQLLGNEMLGLNVDGQVTVGQASAKASGEVNFLGKDKNGNIVFDPQVNVGVSAEAIAAKAEGSVGVNVLGGEVGIKGSVQVGVGAKANVGLKDGVVKCDIGLSLGVGFDLGFEVDVGGMVNTVSDTVSSAWDGFTSGISSAYDGVKDFFHW